MNQTVPRGEEIKRTNTEQKHSVHIKLTRNNISVMVIIQSHGIAYTKSSDRSQMEITSCGQKIDQNNVNQVNELIRYEQVRNHQHRTKSNCRK